MFDRDAFGYLPSICEAGSGLPTLPACELGADTWHVIFAAGQNSLSPKMDFPIALKQIPYPARPSG